MASLMLVVRHIPATAYGVFVLIRVIYTFLAEATSFGLTLVIPKYLAASEDVSYKGGLINTVIYFRVATVMVCGLLVFAGLPFMLHLFGSSSPTERCFLYIPILFGLESVARVLLSILQGLFQFRTIGVIGATSAIANFIATIVFIFPLNLSTMGLVYAVCVSDAVIIVWAYLAICIEDRWTVNIPLLKNMLRFGLPLQGQYMLDFVFARIDTVIIGSWLGTESVALYEIARKLPDSGMYLFDAFQSVYLSFIAKLHSEEAWERIGKVLNNSTRLLSFVTSFGFLGAVLFGKEIISIVFSPKYLSSYYPFVILMFSLSLSVIDSVLGYSLVAIGEATKPLVVNGVRAVLNLSLNLLTIPVFRVIGAAAATVASNLVAAPLDINFLRKKRIPASTLAFFKPLLIGGACSLLFFSVGTSRLSVKFVFMLMFILTSILMSVITREDGQDIIAEAICIRNTIWRKGAPSGIKVTAI